MPELCSEEDSYGRLEDMRVLQTPHRWRSRFQIFGPGLVTGASDDDPSGVATYSQAGAQFGLGLVWVWLVTLPLMAGGEEICDRTALAPGEDWVNSQERSIQESFARLSPGFSWH